MINSTGDRSSSPPLTRSGVLACLGGALVVLRFKGSNLNNKLSIPNLEGPGRSTAGPSEGKAGDDTKKHEGSTRGEQNLPRNVLIGLRGRGGLLSIQS